MKINFGLLFIVANALTVGTHANAAQCEAEFRGYCANGDGICADTPEERVARDMAKSIEENEAGIRQFQNMKGLQYTYLVKYFECIVKLKTSNNSKGSDSAQDTDIITPSIPGCPKYRRKSLVKWYPKPGSNPQLNVWIVKNISNKALNVTYRVAGANTDTGTLNPGDESEVWQITQQPPYVVRDFKELMDFNAKADQNKSLQCSLAIRPR